MKTAQEFTKQVTATKMSTKRVLVIDDQFDVQAVVRACLEEIAGWQVLTAVSGPEGLIRVAADQPDAILLDMMMPGMDGLAFLKALRLQSQYDAIPVVLLTAKINLPQMAELQTLNVKGMVAKPFDPFSLPTEVAALLNWNLNSLEDR